MLDGIDALDSSDVPVENILVVVVSVWITLSPIWNRHPNRSTMGSPARTGFNTAEAPCFSSRTPSDPRFMGQRT